MLSKKELFNAKSSSQKIEKGLQIDVVNVGSYADTDKDGNAVTVSVLVDKMAQYSHQYQRLFVIRSICSRI